MTTQDLNGGDGPRMQLPAADLPKTTTDGPARSSWFGALHHVTAPLRWLLRCPRCRMRGLALEKRQRRYGDGQRWYWCCPTCGHRWHVLR